MAYSEQYGNYVKFLRGTPNAWDSLTTKSADTLYFISEKDATKGKLYLGEKLISDGNITQISQLSELDDIAVASGAADGSLLVFDSTEQKWVNKPAQSVLSAIVSPMKGATADDDGIAGLVPMPTAGQQNLFLQGDGTWADPTTAVAKDISDLKANITTLYAGDTGSIRSIAADEVAKVVASAPESYDTLKEIATWIEKHNTVLDVAEAENRLDALEVAVFDQAAQTREATAEDVANGLADNEGDTIVVKEATTGLKTIVSNLDNTVNGTNGLVSTVNALSLNYTALSGQYADTKTDVANLKTKTDAIETRLKWVDLVEDTEATA